MSHNRDEKPKWLLLWHRVTFRNKNTAVKNIKQKNIHLSWAEMKYTFWLASQFLLSTWLTINAKTSLQKCYFFVLKSFFSSYICGNQQTSTDDVLTSTCQSINLTLNGTEVQLITAHLSTTTFLISRSDIIGVSVECFVSARDFQNKMSFLSSQLPACCQSAAWFAACKLQFTFGCRDLIQYKTIAFLS